MGMMLRELLSGPLSPEEALRFLWGQQSPPVEGPWAELLSRCLCWEPEVRPTMAELGEQLQAWLDDSERHSRAGFQLQQALPLLEKPAQLWVEVERLRREAALLSAPLPAWAPVEKKREAWRREEEAGELEREALNAELSAEQALSGVLSLAPEFPSAHAALARLHRGRLERAELRHDEGEAQRWERLLRIHDRGEHRSWLSGPSFVSILTEPANAEVWARPMILRDRRRHWGDVQFLGKTPLQQFVLERGSWLLELRLPGRLPVSYPVFLGRQQHWDGVPPGEKEPLPIYLPLPGELGEEDCYVPAGWASLGGICKLRIPCPPSASGWMPL